MTTFDFQDGNGPVPAHQHSNGKGWVADTATVEHSVHVSLYSCVYGNAKVCGYAWVFKHAQIYGNAKVFGDAQVFGRARVYGDG